MARDRLNGRGLARGPFTIANRKRNVCWSEPSPRIFAITVTTAVKRGMIGSTSLGGFL